MSTLFVVIATLSILGIRGQHSTKPPLMVFPDMDEQAKYKPLMESSFEGWKDGRVCRPVPAGVVARGVDPHAVFEAAYAPSDLRVQTGKDASGAFLERIPVEPTNTLMQLGKEKYAMTCQLCHDPLGTADGLIGKFGLVGAANYHSDRLRLMPDGEIFNTISQGKGQMLPQSDQLSVEERWAVVLYLRALQKARKGTLADVPTEQRQALEG